MIESSALFHGSISSKKEEVVHVTAPRDGKASYVYEVTNMDDYTGLLSEGEVDFISEDKRVRIITKARDVKLLFSPIAIVAEEGWIKSAKTPVEVDRPLFTGKIISQTIFETLRDGKVVIR